jgi:hypothetical protein
VTFKFFLGLLELHHLFGHFLTIECIQCSYDGRREFLFDIPNALLSTYLQLDAKIRVFFESIQYRANFSGIFSRGAMNHA